MLVLLKVSPNDLYTPTYTRDEDEDEDEGKGIQ
jgi:hypothetical protein